MKTSLKTLVLASIFSLVAAEYKTAVSSVIAEGLCEKFKNHKSSPNKLPQRLQPSQSTPKKPKWWIQWNKCAKKSCNPFKFKDSGDTTNPGPGPETVTSNTTQGSKADIIVKLKEQLECKTSKEPCEQRDADCKPEIPGNTYISSVLMSLQDHAKETQAPVLATLQSKKKRSDTFTVASLWIVNALIIKGASLSEVQTLIGGHADVEDMWEGGMFRLPDYASASPVVPVSTSNKDNSNVNWNIEDVEVDKVLAKGIDGTGIVIGGIVSGAEFTHDALKDNFRGGDYGWFDPILGKSEPYDGVGHGTHVMGTMVGSKEGIGAAPGAKWIACKSCDDAGLCHDSALLQCNQWMLCPTKVDGTEPQCSLAPHIVNNCGFGSSNTRSYPLDPRFSALFQAQMDCWRAIGIIPVFANGNEGPDCGTATFPAVLDNVIAVGNVYKNSNDTIIPYQSSGRGPASAPYNSVVKPDLAAPGTEIYSSVPGNKYEFGTGTSQAAPLVAGIIALILQKNPTFSYDDIYKRLTKTADAVDVSAEKDCGSARGTDAPNHHVGYGEVNAFKAVFGDDDDVADCL